MKKFLAVLMVTLSFGANAEIYKCTVNGLITYGDAPCKKGTGGEVTITYDSPTDEQVTQYRDDLKRRSDDADARTRESLYQSELSRRVARERQMQYERRKIRENLDRHSEELRRKLDKYERDARK